MALDQGITSSRAVVFDHNGSIISMASKEFKQIYPKPGWVEHNPTEIYSSQIEIARDALSKANLTAVDIASIGITNQRETQVDNVNIPPDQGAMPETVNLYIP